VLKIPCDIIQETRSLERTPVQTIPFREDAFPVNIYRKIVSYMVTPWFPLALAIMIFITYILDLMTPLGVPIWLLYFIPLILSFWSKPYYAVPTVCIVTMLFLMAGYVFSPPGLQASAALFMRTVFSVVFICTSFVLWLRRRQMMRRGLRQ
jgi:hypothetical protein